MDSGFDLSVGDDCRDVPCDSVHTGPSKDAHLPDRAVIIVTLCATLFVATIGILYLMATGHNVAKEVSLGLMAQWGYLLNVYAKGLK